MDRIPNRNSLFAGLAVTAAFAVYMIVNVGYEAGFTLVALAPGLPVAFLFLMFSNPKEKEEFDFGIVVAFPFCAIMWPVILLAMLVSRPWKDPKWVGRAAAKPSEPDAQQP